MLYPNLAEAMLKEKVTKTDLSNLLHIHFNTVTAKMEGETASTGNLYQIGFTVIEAMVIRNTLFKSYDFYWMFEFTPHQPKEQAKTS